MIHNVNRLIPEVQCHTAYQIVILWYRSAHINTILWLVRTRWNWFKLSISFHWKAYCFGDASSSIVESLAGESTCLFSKYQADVLCFYYYKYLTHACCTWVADVSKISNESLQLLNCSKISVWGPFTFWSRASNKGGI